MVVYQPRKIDSFLVKMLEHGGTDMYLTPDCKPLCRKGNSISPVASENVTLQNVNEFIAELLDEKKQKEFHKNLEMNISTALENTYRFRINFYMQRYKPVLVIRRIGSEIPTIESLGLPKIYGDVILKRAGLILLASGTGSGKSTSMAAMINHRNINGYGHILTIEDPIEFVHRHNKCIITQREIGTDTLSYSNALKNALRQRADLIVVGEIRDRETLEYVLRFVETGHLCISTIHANNSYMAIDRIANLFPEESKKSILSLLSQNLLAVFSQRLIVSATNDSGHVMAIEILLNQGIIRNLIELGRLSEIPENLAKLQASGMQAMDQSIIELLSNGNISAEAALAAADAPANVRLAVEKQNKNQTESKLDLKLKNHDEGHF